MIRLKMALGWAQRPLGVLCFSALLGGGVATAAPIRFTDFYDVPHTGASSLTRTTETIASHITSSTPQVTLKVT
jgi:hypothetical protein